MLGGAGCHPMWTSGGTAVAANPWLLNPLDSPVLWSWPCCFPHAICPSIESGFRGVLHAEILGRHRNDPMPHCGLRFRVEDPDVEQGGRETGDDEICGNGGDCAKAGHRDSDKFTRDCEAVICICGHEAVVCICGREAANTQPVRCG